MGAMDVPGRLAWDLLSRRVPLPGFVHETASWVVNHVVGSMNVGTLIVSPREHLPWCGWNVKVSVTTGSASASWDHAGA